MLVPSSSFQIRPLNGEIDDKVLLSQLNDEELSLVLSNMQADPFIKRKTMDILSFKGSLNTIRNEGYAVSSGELIMGFMCACAPIKNYLLPAVLIVVGPDVRMKAKIKDIINEIVNAAATISNNLQKYQGI